MFGDGDASPAEVRELARMHGEDMLREAVRLATEAERDRREIGCAGSTASEFNDAPRR
jgi:hypothetical protein